MIRRILLESLALLALTTLAAALTWRFHPERPELYLTNEFAGVGEITVLDALARQRKDGVIWIDARKAEEFAKGRIPDALLLNEYDWETLLEPVFQAIAEAPETRPVIVYCDGHECAASHAVRDKLRQLPFGDRDILVLHGGFPAWLDGDYPVDR